MVPGVHTGRKFTINVNKAIVTDADGVHTRARYSIWTVSKSIKVDFERETRVGSFMS